METDAIELVRKQSGAWLPMITTTQAEAYADQRVREVLEAVAAIVQENHDACDEINSRLTLKATIRAIRALIPKEPA